MTLKEERKGKGRKGKEEEEEEVLARPSFEPLRVRQQKLLDPPPPLTLALASSGPYLVAISSMTSSRIILVMKSVSVSSMGMGELGTGWPAPEVNSRTCSLSDLVLGGRREGEGERE